MLKGKWLNQVVLQSLVKSIGNSLPTLHRVFHCSQSLCDSLAHMSLRMLHFFQRTPAFFGWENSFIQLARHILFHGALLLSRNTMGFFQCKKRQQHNYWPQWKPDRTTWSRMEPHRLFQTPSMLSSLASLCVLSEVIWVIPTLTVPTWHQFCVLRCKTFIERL